MEEGVTRKPFAGFVQEQRNGALHSDLSHALAELVQAASETGKSGTLTLAIKVAANSDGQTVTISDKVTLKLPEADRGAAIFFTDEHGNVSRTNPRQQELPLREVAPPKVREETA